MIFSLRRVTSLRNSVIYCVQLQSKTKNKQKQKSEMSDTGEDSIDEWMESKPPVDTEAAANTEADLLPSKSKQIYETAYDVFDEWKRQNKMKSSSESVMIEYFKELSKKYKPSTLWSTFSMLKATLKIKEQIDIGKYQAFKEFIKKQSSGFVSKKSNVLSAEDVEKFLSEAPDDQYLATKTALVFGISGACRSQELVNVELENITRQGNLLMVKLPTTKTKKSRCFVIGEEFSKIVQRYMDSRPKEVMTNRFFLKYAKGKCTGQVIGVKKFSKMPNEIASYLKLENPETYTGHTFRRTSATLLADGGSNVITLKRNGGCKSSTVAEACTEGSVDIKSRIENMVLNSIWFASAQSSEHTINAPPSKRVKIEIDTSQETMSPDHSDSNAEEKKQPLPNIVIQNCTININNN